MTPISRRGFFRSAAALLASPVLAPIAAAIPDNTPRVTQGKVHYFVTSRGFPEWPDGELLPLNLDTPTRLIKMPMVWVKNS